MLTAGAQGTDQHFQIPQWARQAPELGCSVLQRITPGSALERLEQTPQTAQTDPQIMQRFVIGLRLQTLAASIERNF